MKNIVLYSGGLSSFCTAVKVVKEYKAKNTVLVFCDTKTEDEDLYRFINESVRYLKCELITLVDGRDVWGVFNDVKYMGNSRIDPCSRILKREIFGKWLKENYAPNECSLFYGITWDEQHRIQKLKDRWAPYPVWAPLFEFEPMWTQVDLMRILNESGIKLPRLYELGFPHNNCGGFCVKSGQAQFKKLLEHFPERYLRHEEKQEQLFGKIGQHGFIRKRINGELKYLSMREFRLMVQSGQKIDQFDFAGCECFA